MTLLSLSEIDNICRYLSGQTCTLWPGWQPISEIFDTYLQDIFLNLYKTGLRFSEIQEANRWSIIDANNLEVDTAKGSNDRSFSKSELTTYFFDKIQAEASPYDICRYDTSLYYIRRALHTHKITIGDKPLRTHIFRYHKAKDMYDKGKSESEIQTYLGEVDIRNAQTYIHADIYCDPDPPRD